MDELVLEIEEGTEHPNDRNTYRMHFYPSSITTPNGDPLLSINCRGGGMRATEEQVRQLHKYLGKWLNGGIAVENDGRPFGEQLDVSEVGSYEFPIPVGNEDRVYWYRMQANYVWYRVRACCRSCATRKLQVLVFGYQSPNPHDIVREGDEGQVVNV